MNMLKSFAVGFTILFFVRFIVAMDRPLIFMESLFYGFFGGIAFLLLFLIGYFLSLKRGVSVKEYLSVYSQFETEIPFSAKKTMDFLKQAFSGENIKLHKETIDSLVFRTSFSIKTFGTDISYEITPKETEKTLVKIKVYPALKTTLIDYGDTYEKMEKAKTILSKIS